MKSFNVLSRKCTVDCTLTFSLVVTLLILTSFVWAEEYGKRTVGLLSRDFRSSEGFTLSKPFSGNTGDAPGLSVYLLNNAGNPVHKWITPNRTRIGDSLFLRKNGELVLWADNGFFAVDKDSKVVWEINDLITKYNVQRHHEVVELPNGNFLLPVFIKLKRDEAIQKGFPVELTNGCTGRPLEELYVDNLWELAPKCIGGECSFKNGYEIVWQWNLLDHIVQDDDASKDNYVTNIADHPGKADIGYIDPAGGICSQFIQAAWTFGRFNALDYNPERNEIVISESLMNEIWIIEHAATTEEARGPDGDLIYRWGNPYAYGAGAPFVSATDRGDQTLSFQHRVHWIAPGLLGEGHILIFNNGADWRKSSVMEVIPPIEPDGSYNKPKASGQPFKPAKIKWQYEEPGFFASFVSSAQRLPNGNTLINNGPKGYFFEVTPRGDKVWEYQYPRVGYPDASATVAQGKPGSAATLSVYRAWRYPPDYPGLAFLNLIPDYPLETYPASVIVNIEPMKCPNKLTGNETRVAILGTQYFDVSTINPESIFLEGAKLNSWVIQDIATPTSDGYCECSNVGPDESFDLYLTFQKESIFPPISDSNVTDMVLTGWASSVGWFLGEDCIKY